MNSNYVNGWYKYETYIKNYMIGTGLFPDVSNHKPCWKDITDTMMAHKGVTDINQRYGIVFDTVNMNKNDKLKEIIFLKEITEENPGNGNIRYLTQELYKKRKLILFGFLKVKAEGR